MISNICPGLSKVEFWISNLKVSVLNFGFRNSIDQLLIVEHSRNRGQTRIGCCRISFLKKPELEFEVELKLVVINWWSRVDLTCFRNFGA